MTISRWILLRMRNVSNKSRWESQNIFLCLITFSENRAVYEIKSKNVVKIERPQMTIRRRVACWTSKVTRLKAQARSPAPTHQPTRGDSVFTHTSQCYVIRTLPVFFYFCARWYIQVCISELSTGLNTWRCQFSRPSYVFQIFNISDSCNHTSPLKFQALTS